MQKLEIKHGNIFQLGNHRLMCGDATKREDVIKLIGNDKVNLVLTDPPYGINIVDSGTNMQRFQKIIGDNDVNSAKLHYDIVKNISENQIIWGGNYFTDFLSISRCWIVWDKQHSPKNYADGELAWTSFDRVVKIYNYRWDGYVRVGSKKLNPLPQIHPTQKSVELHMQILEDFSKPDDVVLDCFAGSGTTLIACNETGRKCLTMEFSPEYCDVILNRWTKLAPLIHEVRRIA